MDRYLRAYRDAKSPLTPLTPRCNAFNFDFGGDNSLKDTLTDTLKEVVNGLSPAFAAAVGKTEEGECDHPNGTACPTRFSAGFCRIRDIFETSRNLGVADKLRRAQSSVLTPNMACRTPVMRRKCKFEPKTQKSARTEKKPTIKVEKVEKTEKAERTERAEESAKTTRLGLPGMASTLFSVAGILLQSPLQLVGRGGGGGRCGHDQFKSEFRQGSPVAPQPLSPRIAALLNRTGMTRYAALFQREEIDMEVFRLLTERELHSLGVYDKNDCRQLLAAITMAFERF